MSSSHDRQFRQSLYMLKRQYPGQIEIYQLVSSAVNHQTGKLVQVTALFSVPRAVILPLSRRRDAIQKVSAAEGNSGRLDVGLQDFMVDRQDVPDLPPLDADDWIVYRNSKYQIKTIEQLPWDAGWIISGERIDGEKFQRKLVCTADHFMVFSQSGSAD